MLFKKSRIVSIAIIFAFLFSNSYTAQTLQDLTPPSPKAYELGKYGQTSVGLFTGTVNPSIPLYTYRTKNLQVPISLSYSSNGIKVDELGTNVGLGWSLNIGGVVTRITRDLPDNDRTDFYPTAKPRNTDWLHSIEVMNYLTNAADNANVDSETDLYMFNFNGYSGKFVFDNDHKIVMVPKQDIKIETIFINNKDGFRITTPDGVAYTFQDKEITRNLAEGGGHSTAGFYPSAWYLSTIKHPNGDEITFVYETESYNYITSKQQSLVVTPLQYPCPTGTISSSAVMSSPISYRLTVSGVRLKEIRSNLPEEGKVLITSGTAHPEVSGYMLVSALQVVDKNNVELERADLSYLLTTQKRAFLQKVSMKDPNNNYQFTYDDPTNFVARLSYSQDHWGYYNGILNSDIVPNISDPFYAAPIEVLGYFQSSGRGANREINTTYTSKGILKSITYPTKGYSNFTYEPNTYRGMRTIYPPLLSLDVSVSTTSTTSSFPVSDEKSTGVVNFDQDVVLDLGIGMSGDPNCVSDPSHTTATCTITDINTGSVQTCSLREASGGYVASSHFVGGHSYKLKIQTSRRCTAASATLRYYQAAKQQVADNLLTGGVRIQKVETSDGINATPQVMRYYYGKKENVDVSTGEQAALPRYWAIVKTGQVCELGNVNEVLRYEVSSSSLNTLFNNIGSNSPSYSFVTVSHGGDAFQNGGEEHEFILDQDAPANPLIGDYTTSAPWTNIGFSNGKEKTINTFKKTGSTITVLKKQSNTYVQDSRYHEEVYGYVIQKKYATTQTAPVSYNCDAIGRDNIDYQYYICDKNHDITDPVTGYVLHVGHNWGTLPGLDKWICIAPLAHNVLVKVYDKCYGQPAGTVLSNSNSIDNLNVTEYITNSNWEYLSSTVTTDYDLNGANPIVTTQNFYYDNPVHMQLTRTETTNGGGIIKEKTYYPDDVTTVSSLPGGDLQQADFNSITLLNKNNQYRINTPVQKETYLGSIKRSTVRTIYQSINGLLLPTAIKTLKGEASSTNMLHDKVNYYNYDAKGNVLQASLSNDIYTSYIWGYNGTTPVAIAKNARANEIFFNGFEEGTGWDGSLTAYDATRSHTGKYSGRIDKPTAGEQMSFPTSWLNIPARPAGQTVKYKYSAWVYSTGPSVDLFFFMKTDACMAQPPTSCYFTNVTNVTTSVINKWVYIEGEYDVPDNITYLNVRIDNNGGGSVWFDDVRLHPSAAQMSTFTFQPMVGITSETLPNQQTKKYEYDTYYRLKLIRNGEDAILQRMQYKFK